MDDNQPIFNDIPDQSIKKSKKKQLTQGIRGIVYSYLTLDDLLKSISRLSKSEREFIAKTDLHSWVPDSKNQFKTKLEELSYKKKIVINLNHKMNRNPQNPEQPPNISFESIEYCIRVSEMVILAIDYTTFNDKNTAMFAKFVIDQCIERNKVLDLIIFLDRNFNVENFRKMINIDPKYLERIDGVEIVIGRFEWPNAQNNNQVEPQQNNQQVANDFIQNIQQNVQIQNQNVQEILHDQSQELQQQNEEGDQQQEQEILQKLDQEESIQQQIWEQQEQLQEKTEEKWSVDQDLISIAKTVLTENIKRKRIEEEKRQEENKELEEQKEQEDKSSESSQSSINSASFKSLHENNTEQVEDQRQVSISHSSITSPSESEDFTTETESESRSGDENSYDQFDEEDSKCYSQQLQDLIICFDGKINRLKLAKHERYVGSLFDDDEEEIGGTEENPLLYISARSNSITHIFYDAGGGEIEKNEIRQLTGIFPNIENFAIAGTNIFETQHDLTLLRNLRIISLTVYASTEYYGEVQDDEDISDPETKFEIKLTESQKKVVEQLIIHTDDLQGQDLNYLLKSFGSKYDIPKIKIYCYTLMISQQEQELENRFLIEDLYQQITGITFQPNFKEITMNGQLYTLEKFTKNRTYKCYPVELMYTRKLSGLNWWFQPVLKQTFKIYAEKCELQLRF